MLISQEAQKQVLAYLARSAAGSSSSEAQQRAGALLQLNPGQQVKADIIATLPNSLYLARIAGELYRLEIPLNVKPGESMQLTFVTADPRLTFSVMPQEGGALTVRLSPFGKWLAGVMQETAPLPVAREPLLESPADGAALLTARLRSAVSLSGLFYEAHLAKWAAGGLTLEMMLKEPQGRLARFSAVPDVAAGGEAESADPGFADARTLTIVKEQLLLLNTGRFVWRGEAWPGQGMELTVTEREGDAGETRIEASLALELAELGSVEAKLSMTPEGLSLEFACARPGVSELLKEGGESLRLALASSGLYLRRLAARDGKETG